MATKGVLSSISAGLASTTVYSAVIAAGAVPGIGFVAAVATGVTIGMGLRVLFDWAIPDAPMECSWRESLISSKSKFITDELIVMNPLYETRVLMTERLFC